MENILDQYEETVSVEELFTEELEALEEQYNRLVELDTDEAQNTANSLIHIITYFRVRLGLETTDLEEVYGADPSRTIH